MATKRRLLFAARLRRVLIELAAVILGLGLLTPLLGSNELSRQSVTLLIAPLGALLCALRLRLPAGPWWRQLAAEARDAFLVGGVLFCGCLLVFRVLLRDGLLQLWPPVDAAPTVVVLSVGGVAYLVFRSSVRAWLLWNRLRRRRLLWALTHAHLSVVAAAALLFAVANVWAVAARETGFWGDLPSDNPLTPLAVRLVLNVLPVLAVAVIGTLSALVVVLPPAALVSFLVARRTTRRVERLAAAAEALRSGNYGARVPASGEDELAHLQNSFNAMAARLEQTLGDLHTERDRVAELLEARRRMVAAVSHELRTPVATLRGYLETSLERWDDTPPPTIRDDLVVMDHEARRLQGLIDDLFTLARADAGGLALDLGPVDVSVLARHVAETAAPLAWRAARVTVVAEVERDSLTVTADPARLEQCLVNLVRNGVRHTPPGGIVAIVVRDAPDGVELAVSDTGEGIPPDELPQIWAPFFRGDGARQQDASGAGLGLSLVRELTEAMGGSIAVESAPDAGSVFTLRLPSVPAAKSAEALAASSRPRRLAD